MRVEKKQPKVNAEKTYHERRKHLRNIIHSDDNDLTLVKVANWIGRERGSGYKYIQQVTAGYAGKESTNVLDQIENELRDRGYYEPM